MSKNWDRKQQVIKTYSKKLDYCCYKLFTKTKENLGEKLQILVISLRLLQPIWSLPKKYTERKKERKIDIDDNLTSWSKKVAWQFKAIRTLKSPFEMDLPNKLFETTRKLKTIELCGKLPLSKVAINLVSAIYFYEVVVTFFVIFQKCPLVHSPK